MPDWWQELAMVPGVDDHEKLAHEVWASFQLPKGLANGTGREVSPGPLAPPCLLQENFLPPSDSKFACWDIRELQWDSSLCQSPPVLGGKGQTAYQRSTTPFDWEHSGAQGGDEVLCLLHWWGCIQWHGTSRGIPHNPTQRGQPKGAQLAPSDSKFACWDIRELQWDSSLCQSPPVLGGKSQTAYQRSTTPFDGEHSGAQGGDEVLCLLHWWGCIQWHGTSTGIPHNPTQRGQPQGCPASTSWLPCNGSHHRCDHGTH